MGISLRIVIALLISVAAIIATLIAFIPTYLSGVKAVRSTLSDLRGAYVGRAGEGIDAFFDVPIATLQEVHTAIELDMFNMTDQEVWTKWAANFSYDYWGTINVVTYRLWGQTGQNYTRHRSLDNRFYPSTGTTFILLTNETTVQAWYYDYANYNITDYRVAWWNLSPTYQTYAEITARANPNATVIWTPVYMGWDTPQLAATLVIPDKTASVPTARGCIAAELTPASLNTFFESLGLRAGARAVVVDGNSGLMMGNSWGELSADLLHGAWDVFAPEHTRMKMKTLTNHSDPTMLSVVSQIGVDTVLTGPAPWSTELYEGRDLMYVDVREVTGPGLRLRLLLVMPEIDFMEEVYETQTTTIIIVVVVALVLITAGIGLAHIITRPLTDLQERMELTASLKDTEDDGSLSAFSEVSEMQQSYRRMKKELTRMKSYLPQSVLFPNNAEEGEEEDDEGEVEKKSEASGAPSTTSGKVSRGRSHAASHYKKGFGESQSQRSSRNRSVVAPAGLNTRGEVTNKRVSVIVFNIRHFHAAAQGGNTSAMTKLQKEYLDVITRLTRESKGVVDVFQGDHVTCSFNAVGNCPAHNRRAACVALQVVETLSSHHVTAGISGGNAFVGNMGTDDMKRFCIVGPAVPQAMALERLTKRYSSAVKILVVQGMLQDIEHQCKFAVVDRIRLPSQVKPQLVAALLETHANNATEEWMYDLADNEKSDPFQLLNQAWGNITSGMTEVASQLTLVDKELEMIPVDPSSPISKKSGDFEEGSPTAARKAMPPAFRAIINTSNECLSKLITTDGVWDAENICTDLGPYFSDCVL